MVAQKSATPRDAIDIGADLMLRILAKPPRRREAWHRVQGTNFARRRARERVLLPRFAQR
jgi:hypothetical protein